MKSNLTHKECIVIPSRGRAEMLMKRKTHTLAYAKHSSRPVFLVVRQKEQEEYVPVAQKYGAELVTLSNDVDTIAKTYDEITTLVNAEQTVLFMDDDLTFAHRPSFDSSKLEKVPYEKFDHLANLLFIACKPTGVAMSGLIHRRGAQSATNVLELNRKLIAVMCCKMSIIKQFKWDWGYNSMFDHHMVLQMLESGYSNAQLCNYTHDDVIPERFGFGGCSSYRSNVEHSAASWALADKFPHVVSVRDKVYPGGLLGNDVIMHMKRAYGGE